MIMDKWVNHNFESDIRNTREFLNFARDFKRWLKKDVPDDVAVLDSKPGHFYLSGFLKQDDTNKYIFYSISDVRAFRNKWYNEILI